MKESKKIADLIKKQASSLTKKEANKKNLILGGVALAFLFFVLIFTFSYFLKTETVPAKGGTYTEGLIGVPRFINPLYGQNSEIDRDLTQISFAGLMKYDSENNLVPYLAEKVETDNKRVFNVVLRDDIFWSDGNEITADDIIFTVEKIQNRAVQSTLRIGWEGIRAEKISEREVNFHLENPSPLFWEKLTLKPIPKHIWEDITVNDFQFSRNNLYPVSSGPYKVESVKEVLGEIEAVSFVENPYYFETPPYIEKINFLFFKSEEELLRNINILDGFALPSIKTEINSSLIEYSYQLPRYFALFFNLEKFDKDLRIALRKATDKESLLSSLDRVKGVSSPIIPEFYGFNNPEISYDYDKEVAISVLENKGFIKNNSYFEKIVEEKRFFEFNERLEEDSQGEQVRELQRCLIDLEILEETEITGYFDSETKEAVNQFQENYREEILDPHGFSNPTGIVGPSTQTKLNQLCGGETPEIREVFSIEIKTINHPALIETVEIIKSQWAEIGVLVELEIVEIHQIEKEILEEKNFEIFLFGISMESIPDPFRWWHSSQVNIPGLNFTNYKNSYADELLEKAATSTNKEERVNSLESFQNIILEDKPATFLYSPNYIYMVSRKVKGVSEGKLINSSQRFKNINNWYINTQKIWKKN